MKGADAYFLTKRFIQAALLATLPVFLWWGPGIAVLLSWAVVASAIVLHEIVVRILLRRRTPEDRK